MHFICQNRPYAKQRATGISESVVKKVEANSFSPLSFCRILGFRNTSMEGGGKKMKRYALIVTVLTGLCSPLLCVAQDTDNANNSLQQQLQSIQQSINRPATAPTPVLPPEAQQRDQQQANATALVPATAATVAPTPVTPLPPPNENPVSPSALNLPPPPNVGPSSGSANAVAMREAPTLAETVEGGSDLRDEAFSRMTTNTLPLSPNQIVLLRNLYDATQRAAAVFPGVPPRPTSTSILVNLSPGATPPVIRLGAGFVTSLVFVDASGGPWPIDSYSLGNPTAFNIQWDKKSNILLIQAIAAHKVGNLAVLLRGLNTPVMIDLTPGQAAMDVRVDLRIPGLGPNAKPNYSGLPNTEDPSLLNLLDGIPPPGAKPLKTTACDECVWLLDGRLYLRTAYTVLSPGWISTLSSADGTHVYEMQPTPMILATYNGKMIKINIEGF